MKRVLSIFIVLSVILHSEQGNAQKNYTVKHFTGDNGLPQNSIKGISEDSQGFIWLATEDGLVRYDGQHFYVYNDFNLNVRWNRLNYLQPGKEDSLSKNGRNSIIYASFYNEEIARIQDGAAKLDPVYVKKQRELAYAMRTVGPAYPSSALPDRAKIMDKATRYKIMSGEGDFYICGYDEIICYSGFKQKYTLPFTMGKYWNFFGIGKKLYYMHEDASFKSVFDNKITDIPLSGDILGDKNYGTGKGRIKIFWNNLSRQTFLYLDKNLYLLDAVKSKSTGTETFITQLLVEDFDLITRGVEKIHYNKINQKLFLGSATDGFYVLSKHQFETLTIKGSYLDNVFYSQLPYHNNAVITTVGDIVGKDAETGKIIDQKVAALKAANLQNRRTLLKDKSGSIWIANRGDIYNADSSGNGVIRKWNFPTVIEALFLDESDYLWFAVPKMGLYRVALKNPDAKPELYIKSTTLEANFLESENAHKMLVGTWKGLYRLNLDSKKIEIVKGTEGVSIKSIHVFGDGNSWITALGKGLMLLDKNGELTTFPLDKNRYLANPHCVVKDGRGHFWIPANKGLFQIAEKDLMDYARLKDVKKELFYLYHTRDEGFNTNEFNGSCVPCGLNLKNGYISLPSMNGFVWFRPERISNSVSDGKIILDNVMVNQKLLTASNDTLYFPLNPEQVRLNFSTAYFGDPYNLKISYALVRQNAVAQPSDWIPLEDENFKIEFSNLKSGNFTLLVRKLNGFGIDNYTVKKIYFVVPLLWYQTLWANILMVVLLVAGVYFYNVWRLKKVNNENARLEEIVVRRTKRLNETLADLENSKNEMTQQVHMLSRLLTSMTHDIQSPLNFIKLTSGNIPKLIQKGQLDDVALLGEVISETSRSMSSLLGGLLDYIKAHVFENSLHFEPIDLQILVNEKFEIFKNMIKENGSDFRNEISEDVQVYCDYQMLGIMIHNLIDNAAKFTRKGQIRVYFNINRDNERELVISNTTIGVPKEIQEMINMPDTRNIHAPVLSRETKTSLGLLIVKEIAALVDITLKITQSDVTSFHMIFKE